MSTVAGPAILAAEMRHLDALMAIMASSFDPRFGEAWTARQLSGTLELASSFARQALDDGDAAVGFTLCRSAGPEVELLLIAVRPELRGRGIGRLLIDKAADDAARRGADELFLEVRENNLAARQLYQSAGFFDVGRRPDYYAGASGTRFAAITMRRRLAAFA